jgi:hypothetical protein
MHVLITGATCRRCNSACWSDDGVICLSPMSNGFGRSINFDMAGIGLEGTVP